MLAGFAFVMVLIIQAAQIFVIVPVFWAAPFLCILMLAERLAGVIVLMSQSN
jgi:hypothetical protein